LQIGEIKTAQTNPDHYEIDNCWWSQSNEFEDRQNASFSCFLDRRLKMLSFELGASLCGRVFSAMAISTPLGVSIRLLLADKIERNAHPGRSEEDGDHPKCDGYYLYLRPLC